MARKETNVSAPIRTDGQPNINETASGYIICDGYVISAGPVVFEWNRSRNTPAIINPGSVVASDYRDYESAYMQAVAARIAAGGSIPANNIIEAGLIGKDVVLLSRTNANVNKDSDGLVVFVAASDAVNVSSILGADVKVERFGAVSDENAGIISGVDVNGPGTFRYSLPVQNLDSGGEYVITQGTKGYVFGVQSANFAPSGVAQYAIGTYFTYQEWLSLNTSMLISKTGNLTAEEPVNLLVGSVDSETLTGSGRPDTILGRDGNDIINGEYPATNAYNWGNDYLYGGVGDDTINAYRGNDIMHGGNRQTATTLQSALEADGSDSADYTIFYSLDPAEGIAIRVTDQAIDPVLATHVDSGFGTYVSDLGRGGTDIDLLISIEKVIATNADDILVITKLDPARLAGADMTGGLYKVDLGGQASGADHGDLIDLSDAVTGMTVNLTGMPRLYATENPALKLYVDGAEIVRGSAFGDILTGSQGDDTLSGGGGNDELNGGGGNDFLIAQLQGQDCVDGGNDSDKIELGAGTDTISVRGGRGNDYIVSTQDYNGGATITFMKNDGHDTIDLSALTSNNLSTDIPDTTISDIHVIWNATSIGGGSSRIGDLAIIITSTGDSIVFKDITGQIYRPEGADSDAIVFDNLPSVFLQDATLAVDDSRHLNAPWTVGDVSAYTTARADFEAGFGQSGAPMQDDGGGFSGAAEQPFAASDGDNQVAGSPHYASVFQHWQSPDRALFCPDLV